MISPAVSLRLSSPFAEMIRKDGPAAAREESAVQRWYHGRSVLVTGGTGFMGKVLVEKLLRTTSVSTVYLLVRPKKEKSVQQRLAKLFHDPIFSLLRESDTRDRVVPVEGDVGSPDLGLTPEDATMLKSTVEIIFHGAATVRFDETLRRAILTNVRGTRDTLNLARDCPKLKAFVHISTAYANCTQEEICEELFEAPMTGDRAIVLTECLSDKQLADIAPALCGEYPNTYAFTKAIAENVVNVYGEGMPVIVFRPSIVVATAREPLQGWVDNVYGPTGVQCGVGAGVLRTFQVNKEFVADLVPVDMVVNAIVASAWDVDNRVAEGMRVYNYVSSCQNPLIWGQFIEMGLRHGRQNPTVKAIWWYTMTASRLHFMFLLYQWMLHLLPAIFFDSFLVLSGRKPRLWSVYKKIDKFSAVVTYFSMRQWKFHNDHVLQLWGRLDPTDRQLFHFDISALDWDTFIKNTIHGLRMYFFKDKPETLPAARRKQFWFWMTHQLIKCFLFATICWIMWSTAFIICS